MTLPVRQKVPQRTNLWRYKPCAILSHIDY